MKVDCKIYKGIEYVVLNELPQLQQEKIIETIKPEIFIKILIEGKIVAQCLQYKDYSYWFDNVFKATKPAAVKSVEENISISPNLALNKI